MGVNPIQIKKDLKASKEAHLEQYREGALDVGGLTNALSADMDQAVAAMADEHLSAFKDKVALVFTGANGREEVCPFSDLDVFALVDDSLFDGKGIPEDQEEFAQAYSGLYYAMMDAGLTTSPIVLRTPDHCVEDVLADQETWTQMIDRRQGWGATALYQTMNDGLMGIDGKHRKAFIEAKFEEYGKRLDKSEKEDHSTEAGGVTSGGRYAVIEPNVKNGYGGLRGYQTARWVAEEQCGVDGCDLTGRGIIEDIDEGNAKAAYDFLLETRCHMHDLAGREDDNVTSFTQPALAERMGYDDVASFMRDYFEATREIAHYARMVCSDVAEQLDINPPGMESTETINFADGTINGPMDVLALFHRRAETDIPLHHTAMQAIRKNTDLFTEEFSQDPAANRVMLDILSHENGAEALMRMNRLGVLTAFIPEMEKVRELVQFDPYHAFTVDDHTIQAIGNVTELAQQNYAHLSQTASELAANLTQEDREVLGVALLLHDVHKADQPDDMKSYNRELVHNVGARLGLKDEALETASWLAENHLLMKHTARFQDIEDPEAIEDFASKIPDTKHLELLRVMMMADTLALGPGRLSAHAAFRADAVYDKARNTMMGLSSQFTRRAFELPAEYEDGTPYVKMHENKAIRADVLTVITPDKPYLIENITGAIDNMDCNVLNARVTTVPNGQVRAVNTFVIQSSAGTILPERRKEALIDAVKDAIALDSRMELVGVAASKDPAKNPKNKVFEVMPGVEFSNALSDTTTMIQVTARDRPHLLHDLTSVFNDMDLEMEHANITSQGHRVVNVFRVHKRDGGQVSPTAQVAVKEAIMSQIGEEDTPEVG
ncbi:MAG: HD domain-containing protein [Alcanivorax sp.]